MKKTLILSAFALTSLLSWAQQPEYTNRVAVGYDLELNNLISPDVNVGNGFTLEYAHSFSLSDKHPLFLDLGPKIGYNRIGNVDYMAESSGYRVEADHYTNYTLRLPVSLSYRFDCSKISVMPYAGAHLGALAYHTPNEHDGKVYFSVLAGAQTGVAVLKDRWRFSLDYTLSAKVGVTYNHIGVSVGYCF